MDDQTFWQIIDLFNWDESGDDDAVMEPAINALAKLDAKEIYKFQDILTEKLYAIDTREHCRACYAGELDPDNGDDYISADDFLYSRCVVVANGESFYSSVLNDPIKFPKEMEFESLLSLPDSAYELKTGEEYDHVSPLSYESFENKAGWEPTATTKPGDYTGTNVPPGNRRPT